MANINFLIFITKKLINIVNINDLMFSVYSNILVLSNSILLNRVILS
jgi:hypothetical protein